MTRIGGRSGIIWILIFMIPVVFTSMIHDSCETFLPDSWLTKTFDDIFIKWISQRSLCLVLHSFFWSVQASIFIQNYIDFSTTVSLYHHHSFCYWTLSTSVTGETSGLSAPNARKTGGMLPRKNKNCNSLDRAQLIHMSILLGFSQRLVIHDSPAEVQRFMILQF